ncbi:hypothetical protein [uncultured Lutibacter sp.]|uniref:hypothetical protein n=1 Tax=uncultured Lutibacter sp. TaxID=437739 RepID=UPI00262B8FFE|nr:hypothetical protein [uncultured Lutibacter sp.]
MTTKETPIIVEQLFHASISVIWDAITDIDKMKYWFFDNIPDFKPESCRTGWIFFIDRLKNYIETNS